MSGGAHVLYKEKHFGTGKGNAAKQADQEWYKQNRQLVDIKMTYTEAENEILKEWGMK